VGVCPIRYLKDVLRLGLIFLDISTDSQEKDFKKESDYIKNMEIKILGSGQDAGIPHTGCYCDVCTKARKDIKYRRFGPSIALLDKKGGFCYFIDASPDFKYQLDMVKGDVDKIKRKGKIPVSGILLTHAHFGHCSGLWRLGLEALDEKNLLLFCTPKMGQLLQNNYPFNLLVQRKNIKIKEIQPNEEFELEGFECIPIQVPHRNEAADTVGYIIKSKKRTIYLPDIDYWTDTVIDEIRTADIAIIDGTFHSKDEN
jgi:pyrroloquinoline quinone biosynthesis protein B